LTCLDSQVSLKGNGEGRKEWCNFYYIRGISCIGNIAYLKSVLGIFSGNFLDLKELSAQDGHLGNFITLPMPPQMPCRFWHKLELLITGID